MRIFKCKSGIEQCSSVREAVPCAGESSLQLHLWSAERFVINFCGVKLRKITIEIPWSIMMQIPKAYRKNPGPSQIAVDRSDSSPSSRRRPRPPCGSRRFWSAEKQKLETNLFSKLCFVVHYFNILLSFTKTLSHESTL